MKGRGNGASCTKSENYENEAGGYRIIASGRTSWPSLSIRRCRNRSTVNWTHWASGQPWMVDHALVHLSHTRFSFIKCFSIKYICKIICARGTFCESLVDANFPESRIIKRHLLVWRFLKNLDVNRVHSWSDLPNNHFCFFVRRILNILYIVDSTNLVCYLGRIVNRLAITMM